MIRMDLLNSNRFDNIDLHTQEGDVDSFPICHNDILHFPVLSDVDFIFFRLFGPGLGNLLFPLYRAFQTQRKIGGKLVFPQFFQIKPGPFLRMEKDKRTYFCLFKRRSVGDTALHMRARFTKSISEDVINQPDFQLDKAKIITYAGLKGYFRDLELQHLADFKDYLLGRASHVQQLRGEIARVSKDDICVHLRRGDFSPEAAPGAVSGGMNYRISDEWYVAAVAAARKIFPRARVRIFTDECSVEPKLIARMKCDEVDQSRNALHAVMKMAAHGAIVASKSSFSLWSAFLGQQYMYINNDFELGRYMPNELIECERIWA